MTYKILVLCTGNSCRSQMAEGYFRTFYPEAYIKSAGITAHGLNPLAVKVMAEDGIDISNHSVDIVDDYADMPFDLVLTVCDHANEVCPVFPQATKQIHQNFEDPSRREGSDEEVLPAYRESRNAIKAFIRDLDMNEIIS